MLYFFSILQIYELLFKLYKYLSFICIIFPQILRYAFLHRHQCLYTKRFPILRAYHICQRLLTHEKSVRNLLFRQVSTYPGLMALSTIPYITWISFDTNGDRREMWHLWVSWLKIPLVEQLINFSLYIDLCGYFTKFIFNEQNNSIIKHEFSINFSFNWL